MHLKWRTNFSSSVSNAGKMKRKKKVKKIFSINTAGS
jgi:hypothetical protein